MKKLLSIIFLAILFSSSLIARQDNFVAENFDKAEYEIKMRDGVRLFTIVYTPKDRSREYPMLMQRTPYSIGPYGEKMRSSLSQNQWLQEDLYIFVFQDVRGKFMSEGEFVNMRPVLTEYKSKDDIDETTDTWDTVEWLIKNIKNNNGRVGMYGTSYPGFYTVMGSINAHPAMKCTSPQAPISDWFLWDDMHHNGAFTLPLCFNFFQVFGKERPEPTSSWGSRPEYPSADAYHFFLDLGPLRNANKNYFKGEIDFWNKFTIHSDYDEFWQARSTLPHLKDITPAVLTVGGWYDGEDLSGALHTYKSIEKQDPKAENALVMGPWTHGGWAFPDHDSPSLIPFKQADMYFFQKEIEYPFFTYYLKGEGELDLPEAWIFETGSDNWNAYDSWPPDDLREMAFYLESGSKILEEKSMDDQSYDEYISDPFKPVPYTAPFQDAKGFYNRQYLSEDQRFASTRTDVLVFDGEVLEEDLSLAGPVHVELYVSTTGTDADWVVKLIDVFPDTADNRGLKLRDIEVSGYQMLVRGDIFRGKYRNSFEEPEPFIPGEVTKVSFDLPDISHCFKKGHRMMIQVQSSWFPIFDRNPQTFTDIYNCGEEAFQKATHRVYHTQDHPSGIRVYIKEHD